MTEIKKKTPGEKVKRFKQRFDSYSNPLTGIGFAGRDKLLASQFYRTDKMNDDVLENMYHDNDIAARVCDAIPDHILRQGFDIIVGTETYSDDLEDLRDNNEDQVKYADQVNKLLMQLDELEAKEKITDALVWANVFGGCAIYVGVDDGRAQDQPIDMNNIKNVTFLKVVDKRYIFPTQFYEDPLDPKFAQPLIYTVFPASNTLADVTLQNYEAQVHESRIIPFYGTRTSNRRSRENRGWAESILQKLDEVLRQFSVSWQSTAHLMQDAAQAVFKMYGVVESMSANMPDYRANRLADMDMNRSNVRTILVDAELGEDFRRDTYSFNGIPQILELFMSRLAAAVDIPVTLLFGISPGGLNATGESEMRIFYDRIKAAQKYKVKPKIEYILRLLMLARKGPMKGKEFDVWSVSFPSPWQSTDLEKSEIHKNKAMTKKLLAEADAIEHGRIPVPGDKLSAPPNNKPIPTDLNETSKK